MTRRYPELDLARTLAIALMVLYHLGYDLEHFYGIEAGMGSMVARAWQVGTAALFLLVAGMTTALSLYARTPGERVRTSLQRAVRILAAAVLVTAATLLVVPDAYVRFGILHLIGVGALLLPLFLPLKEAAIVLGVIWIAVSAYVAGLGTDTPLLLPLGVLSPGFRSVDYYPLFPWFGVLLIGLGMGYALYARGLRPPPAPVSTAAQMLGWPGRHSLILYLIHQPVILTVLWLVMGRPDI